MSIKIHHGPDGTFKTSGAIKDDIIKLCKTPRTLVTNVRGFSRQKCVKVLGRKNVHQEFDVIFVDTDVLEGRQKLAKFFHWAPKGAYFVIDEIQRIWHPKATEKELATLNYPENQDHLPEQERKPETIHVAWDMQRHHNWDFVFTTTNIAKVHSMCRLMAKVAVRHVNMGIWRFYKTVEHDAENNGKSATNQTSVSLFNYVPKKVFDLYQSTTTGAHTNVEPRTPVYKDPKLLILVSILVVIGVRLSTRTFDIAPDKDGKEDIATSQNAQGLQVAGNQNSLQVSNIHGGRSSSVSTGKISALEKQRRVYLDSFNELYLTGYSQGLNNVDIVFTGYKRGQEYTINSNLLNQIGYEVLLLSECVSLIKSGSFQKYAFCPPTKVQFPIGKSATNTEA